MKAAKSKRTKSKRKATTKRPRGPWVVMHNGHETTRHKTYEDAWFSAYLICAIFDTGTPQVEHRP